MNKDSNKKIIWGGITLGFALMASYFGAGNTVIPASIGYAAGDRWGTALIAFFLSGILLPIITLTAVTLRGGQIEDMTKPLGPAFSKIYFFLMMIPLMVFIGVPRMIAVSYELGFNAIFPGVPVMLYSAVFVVIIYICVRNPHKTLDIVGKYLTPILLVMLAIVIARVIVSPVAKPIDLQLNGVFTSSLLTGYGTGDATASFMFATIFFTAIAGKVRTSCGDDLVDAERKKAECKMFIIMVIVEAVTMLFVYGGLLYMGAQGTGIYSEPLDETTITLNMIRAGVGNVGIVIFGIAAIVACFTTAVSAIDGMGSYVSHISNGKLSHKVSVAILLAIVVIFSKVSVAKLLSVLYIIMGITYPFVMIITVFAFIYDKIPEKRRFGLYLGACVVQFALELVVWLNTLGIFTGAAGFISKLPLVSIGFEWVVPSIIGAIIGFLFIKKPQKQEV